MVLQVSHVLMSIHMDKTVMVFHICQFEIFIKLGNFTARKMCKKRFFLTFIVAKYGKFLLRRYQILLVFDR
jgi:hypothetical protein